MWSCREGVREREREREKERELAYTVLWSVLVLEMRALKYTCSAVSQQPISPLRWPE